MRFRAHRRAMLAGLSLVAATGSAPAQASTTETYGGRTMIVHAPERLPPPGARALVVVLHGGLGSADRIVSGQAESALNLDALADRDGFVVAYLNGTPVTRRLGGRFLGWNAGGGCCGMSAENGVDDVAYIKGAVEALTARLGIDPGKVYAAGHSNGAMMAQRLACETRTFAAVVAISGPLNLDVTGCPAARGGRILAVHGADDQNVPVAGGVGGRGLSRVAYQSEGRSKQVFEASGAIYDLQIVTGAAHDLGGIDAAVRRAGGVGLGERMIAFFELRRPRP